MDSKQLSYFKELYTSGNITKTAEELYVTRQAISLSIRRLEQEVGAILFRRTKNGLIPTDAAHILLNYIDKQQSLWEDTLRQIHNTETEKTIRIAMHVMYLNSTYIRQLKNYWKEPGGCRFQVINLTDSGKCQMLLEEGMVDVAVTHKPPHTSRLSWRKLYDSEAWLLMRESDPLANREVIDFSTDLTGRHLLFASQETLQEVSLILSTQGALYSYIESDRILLWQSIDVDGSLFVFPDQALDNFLREGLVARKLTHFPVVNGVYLIWQNENLDMKSIFRFFKIIE